MRTLSASEINVLQQQGCLADDWSAVTVADAFNPQYIRNVRFSGPVELGCFERSFVAADGFPRHSGIYNAALHNCKVGDDCYIGNVRDHIANYNRRVRQVQRCVRLHRHAVEGMRIDDPLLDEVDRTAALNDKRRIRVRA